MCFQFEKSETVAEAVRRTAAEQLDKAIAASEQRDADLREAVHDVRRGCKRVRALIQLVRGSLEDFKRRDKRLRKTARMLSDVRDAAVLPATHALVAEALPGLGETSPLSELSATLSAPALADKLGQVRDRLITARADVDGWRLDRSGFDAIRKGLRLTYARSRETMKKALRSTDPRACHKWRKHVKYHAFHMQLLHDARPDVMAAREAAADELGHLLGRIHDFDVYRGLIGAASDGRELRRMAEKLGDERLERCRPLAEQLFAQKPTAFRKDMEAWWDAWHGQ